MMKSICVLSATDGALPLAPWNRGKVPSLRHLSHRSQFLQKRRRFHNRVSPKKRGFGIAWLAHIEFVAHDGP